MLLSADAVFSLEFNHFGITRHTVSGKQLSVDKKIPHKKYLTTQNYQLTMIFLFLFFGVMSIRLSIWLNKAHRFSFLIIISFNTFCLTFIIQVLLYKILTTCTTK